MYCRAGLKEVVNLPQINYVLFCKFKKCCTFISKSPIFSKRVRTGRTNILITIFFLCKIWLFLRLIELKLEKL